MSVLISFPRLVRPIIFNSILTRNLPMTVVFLLEQVRAGAIFYRAP